MILYKHVNNTALLLLLKKGKGTVNTFVEVNKDGQVINLRREWSGTIQPQYRIVLGFDKLTLITKEKQFKLEL